MPNSSTPPAQNLPQSADALAEYIAQRCGNARQTKDGWKACCPAHDDHHPSLDITPSSDRILLRCRSKKCAAEAIMGAIGMTLADLFIRQPTNGRKRSGKVYGTFVNAYPYVDVNGHLLHETVRYEPKRFSQRRPDPAKPGATIPDLQGVELVLYHLPEVLAAVQRREMIYLCEGEKDAENVQALGLTATCNAMGAEKWRTSYSETLRGADVVMLPHNDTPGRKHGELVARALAGIAASVTVVELPGLPNHGDISDWLAAGGTRPALEAMVEAAPLWTPAAAQTLAVPPIQVSSNGHSPAEADPSFGWNDYVNALHLVREFGADLRYCWPWKKWLVWRGSHWQHDSSGHVIRAAKATIKRLAQQVQNLPDVEAKALLRHIKESLATSKLKAMVESAQSEPDIPVQPEALDTHGWLLNVKNGTIDLRTGTLQPHQQANLLTKCLSIPYDPSALCPTWERFLRRIMGGTVTPDDPDMSEGELDTRQAADDRAKRLTTFLQRAIGYSLTGDTREQCLFVFHGSGANGKSTLLELLQALLGDYAQSTPSASLLVKDRHEGIPNDIARLRGARLVTAVEIGEGKRLNEELVKRLTGQDRMTARFLHAEFFDFTPEFKLFIACNHLPNIRNTDHAMWRRVKLIPFAVTIPDEEQDKDLPAKLQAELPGILRWAVQGCLDWQKSGLETPEEVQAATQDYRASQDVLGRFIDECCLIDRQVRVKASVLYDAYKKWCEDSGEYAVTHRNLGVSLSERGLEPHKGTAGTRWWVGIGLNTPAQ